MSPAHASREQLHHSRTVTPSASCKTRKSSSCSGLHSKHQGHQGEIQETQEMQGLSARGCNPKHLQRVTPDRAWTHLGARIAAASSTHLLVLPLSAMPSSVSILVPPSTRAQAWLHRLSTLIESPSRPACNVAKPGRSERRLG